MKRINVIGTTGSGKSTLSKTLAEALGYPYLQMDQLFWKPNWQEPTDEEFFPILNEALTGDTWVLDGNYSRTSAIKWERVDAIIWIDLGFTRTLWQLLSRTVKRATVRKELWPGTGNRDSLSRAFFSKESILFWFLRTYHRNRVKYAKLMQSEDFANIQMIQLRSRREVERFIEQVRNQNIQSRVQPQQVNNVSSQTSLQQKPMTTSPVTLKTKPTLKPRRKWKPIVGLLFVLLLALTFYHVRSQQMSVYNKPLSKLEARFAGDYYSNGDPNSIRTFAADRTLSTQDGQNAGYWSIDDGQLTLTLLQSFELPRGLSIDHVVNTFRRRRKEVLTYPIILSDDGQQFVLIIPARTGTPASELKFTRVGSKQQKTTKDNQPDIR